MAKGKIGWLATVGLVCLLVSAGARAEYEGVSFGVELYGGPSPQCSASGLNSARNDADAVRDALSTMGYPQSEYYEDDDVDGYDFIDDAYCWWCSEDVDPTGTDFADVIFFSGHGGRTCASPVWRSAISLGDSTSTTNACWLSLGNMRLSNNGGDASDANVMMLSSCQSAQKCVWDNHGFDSIVSGSTQFNILNGFHGLSWDNDDNTSWLGSYVTGAETEGLGDDWIDWMTDASFWYTEDQCATSMTWGTDSAACDLQEDHGGFMDFKITNPLNVTRYYYLSPCDPEDGEAL